MKSITLYHAKNPFWLTDASIQADGDLRITSGDADNEWSKVVPAERKPMLLGALLNHVTLDYLPSEATDDQLLRALSAMFAGNTNPYEDFKAFLERYAIPAEDSNWLWSGD